MTELNKAWDIYYGVGFLFERWLLRFSHMVLLSGLPQGGETIASAHHAGFAICLAPASESTQSRAGNAWCATCFLYVYVLSYLQELIKAAGL